MAYNVFGTPITTTTLAGMPEYAGKSITRQDRAYVALHLKNSQDKDKKAREYVEKLKEQWGRNYSTLCLIYNATGDPITLIQEHNWYGELGPAPLPVRIENGQWGGFIHIEKPPDGHGSHAVVVYSGLNGAGIICNWMTSWINPAGREVYDNSVYSEIREDGYYTADRLAKLHTLLDKYAKIKTRPTDRSNLFVTGTWNGCATSVSSGSGSIAVKETIFTLEAL